MNFIVYDPDMNAVHILDQFKSMIWTERYNSFGDFELYTPVDILLLNVMSKDMYVWFSESDRLMIIDRTELTSDPDDGVSLKVTGKSIEALLDRRIVWSFTEFKGSFQDGIEKLLNENAISPSNPDRKIPRLVFKKSTDKAITDLTIEYQYHGESLYKVISSMCSEKKVGFRITLSDDDLFIFELYSGADRSYSQLDNPYVVFSPGFDNLMGSNYINSVEDYRTVTLVGGDGEGASRKTLEVSSKDGGKSGIFRREMFTEATVSSTKSSGGSLSKEEYEKLLTKDGLEDLDDYSELKSFEGQVDDVSMYVYGKDYAIGDIVQIENEYGINSRSRVVELVRSISDDGVEVYPTFEDVKET